MIGDSASSSELSRRPTSSWPRRHPSALVVAGARIPPIRVFIPAEVASGELDESPG